MVRYGLAVKRDLAFDHPSQVFGFIRNLSKYRGGGRAGSAVKFKKYGQSGLWMSEAFPELGKHADELCLINSMHTDVPNHPQSFLMMHTGEFRFPRPSVGSWVLYGLGSQNENLPGFITINPPITIFHFLFII